MAERGPVSMKVYLYIFAVVERISFVDLQWWIEGCVGIEKVQWVGLCLCTVVEKVGMIGVSLDTL